MEARLQEVITDVLGDEIPAQEISSQIASEWDSLNHLNLILALEEEFNLEIPPEDFPQLHSNYNFIVSYIKQKLS